jgi:hypothetical protein
MMRDADGLRIRCQGKRVHGRHATAHLSRLAAVLDAFVRYGGGVKRKTDDPEPLPSRSSAGELIGGILAGLDHALTGRPKPTPQIEEQYNEPWASADGLTVEGLDDPVERPEQPDRSGAKL